MKNGSGLKKIAAGWLLALILAVAAAVITISLVSANSYGPQQPIRDYLQALQDGDGAKALGLLRANVPAANPALLDGDGLKAAAAQLSDVHIGNPEAQDGGRVKVNVSYTLAGAAQSTDFTLEQTGKQWLFFSTWAFVPAPLPTLDVSVVNEDQASVNGVPVNMPAGRNRFAVFYPGQYKASYQSKYFQAPEVTTTVSAAGTQPAPVSLATGPSPALVKEVGAKIHQYLDSCAKQQVLLPAGCPFSDRTDNRVVGPIQWSIASYPKIGISAYGGHWVMAPLTVKAQVAYREQQLFTGAVSDVKKAQDFGFTAKLDVTDSGVSVTPVVDY